LSLDVDFFYRGKHRVTSMAVQPHFGVDVFFN